MGQVVHGSASTTAAVRRAIQNSQESLRAPAKRHGINQKTVAKWRKRSGTSDLRPGPKDVYSTRAWRVISPVSRWRAPLRQLPCKDADNWKGLLIPGVDLIADPASLFDSDDERVPLGSIVRGGTYLAVTAKCADRFGSRTRNA